MPPKTTPSQPILTRMPKRSLDYILHYLLQEKIRSEQELIPPPFYRKRHPTFLLQYYKSFQLVSRLRGTGLCLLKTQYSKKPKNPE